MRESVVSGSFPEEYLDWRRLRTAMESTGGDPSGVFVYLNKILEGDRWRALKDMDDRPFVTFRGFVEDRERGLNMDVPSLERLLSVVGSDEREKHHRPELFSSVRTRVRELLASEIPAANANGGDRRSGECHSGAPTQAKRDADAITARLKRDDPALAEKVVKGEVTANAAAKLKGWRKPRIVLSSPESVAKKIREHFTDDQVDALIQLLEDDGNP